MKRLFFIIFITITSGLHSFAPSPFPDIIEKTIPAVVFIVEEVNSFDQAYGDRPATYQSYLRPVYEYFWPSQYAHGSGFLMSSKGHVLTCAHCVKEATKTLVIVQMDGMPRVYPAKTVGIDVGSDLAVLCLETTDELPYLPFGDSDRVRLGEPVIAIGTPMSARLESSVSMGIISGKDRNFGWDPVEGYIQTDTPIHSGNSGGPLLNSLGEVIGVVNFKWRGHEGLGFVTPSNFAASIANQLITTGTVSRAFLGVEVEYEVDSVFDVYYFYRNQGALVTAVVSGSPADRAGLTVGDRILFVDEMPIPTANTLINRLWTVAPGRKIQLSINRRGNLFPITLELSDRYSWRRHSEAV